jgi:hypothetical protein
LHLSGFKRRFLNHAQWNAADIIKPSHTSAGTGVLDQRRIVAGPLYRSSRVLVVHRQKVTNALQLGVQVLLAYSSIRRTSSGVARVRIRIQNRLAVTTKPPVRDRKHQQSESPADHRAWLHRWDPASC